MNIGDRIRKLRTEKNIKQTKLAEMIDSSSSVLSAAELGKITPTTEMVIELSKIFNVSADYLLTRKEGEDTISKEEQEVIEMYRKDSQMKEAIEIVLDAKKKAINYIKIYAQSQSMSA